MGIGLGRGLSSHSNSTSQENKVPCPQWHPEASSSNAHFQKPGSPRLAGDYYHYSLFAEKHIHFIPGFIPFSLILQALRAPSRKRLLVLSLAAVQHSISRLSNDVQKLPYDDFVEEVANVLVECTSAVGQEWTGEIPDYGVSELDLIKR